MTRRQFNVLRFVTDRFRSMGCPVRHYSVCVGFGDRGLEAVRELEALGLLVVDGRGIMPAGWVERRAARAEAASEPAGRPR